jgi:hypothetical protein
MSPIETILLDLCSGTYILNKVIFDQLFYAIIMGHDIL